ncbi:MULTISPECIES: hydroxymethylglutaryl-CoA lyase [Halomonas]|uniref:hydroxymethylglutaryl-CoA lyase n=1 Tax=Halomonas TaxID=2745 RepID=UPI001C96C42E|nr:MULTISPECIES: hydroxymethylglutaryl-CoA lyase [Halomonas]MBY5968081.1 hydroxymethylglutaryl-CoA lyase [Halomonas denitrificans]MBY6206394.1 hydroxymethylglutaryl-CoA lyase [Halomonas sp. DP3Y7-2]MBY6227715.1 hydroxymethylglutaryl-CoA lyase [Halomonas sp. DP3Y7-1]MCA0915782.1 hydroxymethylglutaryl-CoA lyase [Halomonas denitrificans]
MVSSAFHSATICEVGLRDGLQSLAMTLPTERKLRWIEAAYRAGLREIEVGSFVPPRLMPQLADTAELVSLSRQWEALFVSVLVPNLKGAELAIDSAADLMLLPLSASHAHSIANVKKTPDEMVEEVARIRDARDSAASATLIEVGIGTAFGCTLQGEVPREEVLRLLEAALQAGADRVSLADTVGYADPQSVRELFTAARQVAGDALWRAHFHDTRGLALANTLAALDVGITRFDASLAGIGGCPHAPGASGNTTTEDLVFMLEAMGLATGVDIDRLLELRADLVGWLDGEATHGTLWRAGLPRTFCRGRVAS